MLKNLRTEVRQRTLLPAKIVFNNKHSVFDCVVKDFSNSGARLKVASTFGIPDYFTLIIPHYEQRFPAWIVWSTGAEIGVSFSPRPDPEEKPDLQIV
jgi:PilZ domain